MAPQNYESTLRGAVKAKDKEETGVPFFVPQFSKVKTSTTCQANHKELCFSFESMQHHHGQIPYRKQGDKTWYSEQNIAKRENIRNNPKLVKMLESFWNTFSIVKNGGTRITRRHYVDACLKMYKALVRPEEFSVAEARTIIHKDWGKDAKGLNYMTETELHNALFEVADIWTPEIGAELYSEFLSKLYRRITLVVYDKDELAWLTKYAELEDIKSFHEVPAETGERVLPTRQRSSRKLSLLGSGSQSQLPGIDAKMNKFRRQKSDISSYLSSTKKVDSAKSKQRRNSTENVIAPSAIYKISDDDSTNNESGSSWDKKEGLHGKHHALTGHNTKAMAMPSIYLNPDLDGATDRSRFTENLQKSRSMRALQ